MVLGVSGFADFFADFFAAFAGRRFAGAFFFIEALPYERNFEHASDEHYSLAVTGRQVLGVKRRDNLVEIAAQVLVGDFFR
jgi:hypothetical protein